MREKERRERGSEREGEWETDRRENDLYFEQVLCSVYIMYMYIHVIL